MCSDADHHPVNRMNEMVKSIIRGILKCQYQANFPKSGITKNEISNLKELLNPKKQ